MSTSERGLRQGALSGFDSVVMAIAGNAPAYSIAATTAVLISVVGLASPAALLYSAIPMLGIAWAFNYLGRADVNAGASYSWVGRALHPALGFLSGWALVVSATIFMVAGSLPAGELTLSLFSEDLAANTALATAVGAMWFLVMVGLVMAGVTVTAKAQWIMTGAEVVLLVLFAVLGLARLGGDRAGADFSWSWFGFDGFGGLSGFAAGALIAAFYFWGWDVTANLNEETEGRGRRAGLGGLIGVLFVFVLFELYTILTNMLLTPEEIEGDAGNVLARLGDVILPGGGGKLLIIAVMLSTIATLETTLIQVSRSLFAMGRDNTVPAAFGRVHPVRQTPVFATGVVAVVVARPVRRLELPGHGGGRARGRDQRPRPADRVLLRPGRARGRAGLSPRAVPFGVQPGLHRPVAAARCGLHVLGLHRVAARARHDDQDRRYRGAGPRPDPAGLVLGQGRRLLPAEAVGDVHRSRGGLPGAPVGERGRRNTRTGLTPTATSPAPRFAAQGTSAVLACPRPSPRRLR